MAANQTSNQRDKAGTRHQVTQPARRPAAELDDSAGSYGSIGEMAEQASDYIAEGASQAREFARERGGATVVAALVTGFGIGLVVGHAVGMPKREPKRLRDRIAAEGLGRRLLDRIEGMIPDALAEHFGK